MRNVALFGAMAAGKSTISAALAEAGYHRMSFAAPLKNVATLAYGRVGKSEVYTVTNLDGTQREISGREILQGIGQSIKSLDRDYWLRVFLRDSANYLDTPLVVDDGRFIFERDALQSSGWLIVGVDTPRTVRLGRYETLYGRAPTPVEEDHESEREIPSIVALADVVVDGEDDPYENTRLILERARA